MVMNKLTNLESLFPCFLVQYNRHVLTFVLVFIGFPGKKPYLAWGSHTPSKTFDVKTSPATSISTRRTVSRGC